MKILGIESSADETAAAVVEDGNKLLSSVVATSLDQHTFYGGIVPEIAARSHIESVIPVVEEALGTAFQGRALEVAEMWSNIDAIAVTYGPGLSGSLLIGVLTARTLAIAKNKPLYAVNHVEAHVYASFITSTSLPGYKLPAKAPEFPLLALIVSGGHSQLVLFKNHFDYKILGQTADDAVGEAFDKVAKILGLPYPGGPFVSQAAKKGNPHAVSLPKARMQNGYDYSFSGLKTAVLRTAQQMVGKDFTFPSSALPATLNDAQKADLAASFQHIAIETLVDGLKAASEEFEPKSIVIAGGVAANRELRNQADKLSPKPIYTDVKLCTDNAAMIAANAYYQASDKRPKADPYSLEIDPSLQM
jgi:N6-L-threonylcarbamoyladenine synthase